MKKIYYFDKENLQYKPISTEIYLYIIIGLIVVFLLGMLISRCDSNVNIKGNDPTSLKPFSEDALINLLENSNIKYPYIVLAQAKLESAYFTSKIFKSNNNMFGMRKARQRITTAECEKNTYAYYKTWEDCVYDYGLWQNNVICGISSEEDYFNKLSERYAEDTMYVSKLKTIIKAEKLKNIFKD